MSYSKSIAIALTTFACTTAVAVDAGAQSRGGRSGGGHASGGARGPSAGGGAPRGGAGAAGRRGPRSPAVARGAASSADPGIRRLPCRYYRTTATGTVSVLRVRRYPYYGYGGYRLWLRCTACRLAWASDSATRTATATTGTDTRTTAGTIRRLPATATCGGAYVVPRGAAYGGVRIQGAPRDAQVFVDGTYAGVVDDFDGTFQHLDLEPGSHAIEIRTRRPSAHLRRQRAAGPDAHGARQRHGESGNRVIG